ncbi:HipA domain-containing protein [Mucilaginibacter corticis]|uniref:HipA domain-containing protein n=1 Tax=Mucilaginibacter corticis TaxID=2597670 RepID=UPI001FE7E975|nr:HipA domain-containing protein [Mucilaginibacter corticis]
MSLKTEIQVYFQPAGAIEPVQIGVLTAHQAKTRKASSFEYLPEWLQSKQAFMLDPEILLYKGLQYPTQKESFGAFADAMQDSWGRKLMQRRAAQKAAEQKEKAPKLYEIDCLLCVNNLTRMGALRFRLTSSGPFLDNDNHHPVPPWTSLRELQSSAEMFDKDDEHISKEHLELLLAHGSSLGGARPKANIVDEKGDLWIAKFPAKKRHHR